MNIQLEHISPNQIEQRSFEIISKELGDMRLDPEQEPIIKRCIHTSADFDYAKNLVFSPNAVQYAKEALKKGACIVTDTQMGKSGINKAALEQGTTRAVASMDKAVALNRPTIFAIGNAPTALIRLYELIQQGLQPEFIIGVPVGFVNVVESKELILSTQVPYIVARGRKGGSNIAAAICNALLYSITGRDS